MEGPQVKRVRCRGLAVVRRILDAHQELFSSTWRWIYALDVSRDQAVLEIKTAFGRNRVGVAKALHRIRGRSGQHIVAVQGANHDADLLILVVDVIQIK